MLNISLSFSPPSLSPCLFLSLSLSLFAQSLGDGAVKYIDCLSEDAPNECSRYDTKQFDGEVPVIMELWGMQSTPSLPLLPGLSGQEW